MPFLNITFWLLVGFVIGWFAHSWQTSIVIEKTHDTVSTMSRSSQTATVASDTKSDTSDTTPYMETLRKQLARGEMNSVMQTYSDIVSVNPAMTKEAGMLLIQQAERLIGQRRVKKTYELINRYLQVDAYNPDAFLILAKLEMLNLQYEQALQYALDAKIYSDDEILTEAVNVFIKNVTTKYEGVLRRDKQWEKLANMLSTLLENTDDEAQAMMYHYKIGEAQFRQGKLREAIVTLGYTLGDPTIGAKSQNLIRLMEQVLELEDYVLIIPITANNNQFLIEVGVNGDKRAELLIDTGANISILTESFVAAVGLNNREDLQRGEITIHTASDVKTVETITLEMLELGGIEFENMVVGVTELPSSDQFDGLLGMDVLSFFEFQIDQTNEVLRLEFNSPT